MKGEIKERVDQIWKENRREREETDWKEIVNLCSNFNKDKTTNLFVIIYI